MSKRKVPFWDTYRRRRAFFCLVVSLLPQIPTFYFHTVLVGAIGALTTSLIVAGVGIVIICDMGNELWITKYFDPSVE